MADFSQLSVEQDELARRRKLLSAMQAQNMGGQITGNTGQGLVQALSKVATAYMLAQQGKSMAGEDATNRKAYQDTLGRELQSYIQQRDGTPGETMSQDQAARLMYGGEDTGNELREPVKAAPREAIVRAMASASPEMQQIGKADFGSLQKQAVNPMEFLKLGKEYGQSRVAAAMGGGHGVLQSEQDPMVINNQLVKAGGQGAPAVLGDFRDQFGPTKNVNGEAVQFEATTGKAHQVANRPAQSNTRIVMPGQKAGLEELAKQYAKNVSEMGQTAQASLKLSGALSQLGKLTEAGTFTGPMADPAIWLNRLAGSVGISVDKDKLSNSEAYNSVANEAAQRLVSQFGGNRGVTAEEAAQIKQIIPQLQASPQARGQLQEILQSVAQRQIQAYKQAHSNYVRFVQTQDPTQIDPTLYGSQMPTEDPGKPMPGAGPGGQPGTPMDWRDYASRLKGGL